MIVRRYSADVDLTHSLGEFAMPRLFEHIVTQIEALALQSPIPSDVVQEQWGDYTEAEQFFNTVAGKRSTYEQIFSNRSSLFFLLPEAYAYVIPFFLRGCLEPDGETSNEFVDYVVDSLTTRIADRELKLSADMVSLFQDFFWLLLGMLYEGRNLEEPTKARGIQRILAWIRETQANSLQ